MASGCSGGIGQGGDPEGGFADISIYDVIDANGVVHVIDEVLLPAQNP